MKYGYICSRTKEAAVHYQRFLKEQGAEAITVDIDGNMTINNSKRESLPGLLESLKPGDSLFVMRLEQLSRNLDELKEILETLCRKEILLYTEGIHIDFNDDLIRKDLKAYFRDTRGEREAMQAEFKAFQAKKENLKKKMAGE